MLVEHQTNSSLRIAIEAIILAGPGEYWVGGKRAEGGSNYVWSSDNSEVNEDYWGPGYPIQEGNMYREYLTEIKTNCLR